MRNGSRDGTDAVPPAHAWPREHHTDRGHPQQVASHRQQGLRRFRRGADLVGQLPGAVLPPQPVVERPLQRRTPGEARLLFEGPFFNPAGPSYDVAPDGRFLWPCHRTAGETTRELMWVEDWTRELPR